MTCFSPYNISVNITGYNPSNKALDVNVSKFVNVSMSILPSDTCTYSSGDWNINCADNCVITTDTNLNGNNIHTYGSGNLEINALIYNFGRFVNRCNFICRRAAGCFG